MLDGLYRRAAIVADLPIVVLSPDPDDNKIIAIAVGGHANYLVSGDKADLLSLGIAHDIPIVRAHHKSDILTLP